jgi:hypothetical protein
MSDIKAEEVRWLWHPYIPFGKVTLVMGDPGDGKTTFVLAIAALLTKGELMPECAPDTAFSPLAVIYQTAEDGLADTIKPRLDGLGAYSTNVYVIDDSDTPLSLIDSRIEQTVRKTKAGLLILDPLQAYLGSEIDMHRANEVRPAFKRLGEVAERTGCAIVIIGHMNKGQGKGMYRGLGSIDINAAARSILIVGREADDTGVRMMAHLISSCAEEGRSVAFDGGGSDTLRWLGYSDVTVPELRSGFASGAGQTKLMLAQMMIADLLKDGEKPSAEVYARLKDAGISQRTAEKAKALAGAKAFKRGAGWYWRLEADGTGGDAQLVIPTTG